MGLKQTALQQQMGRHDASKQINKTGDKENVYITPCTLHTSGSASCVMLMLYNFVNDIANPSELTVLTWAGLGAKAKAFMLESV